MIAYFPTRATAKLMGTSNMNSREKAKLTQKPLFMIRNMSGRPTIKNNPVIKAFIKIFIDNTGQKCFLLSCHDFLKSSPGCLVPLSILALDLINVHCELTAIYRRNKASPTMIINRKINQKKASGEVLKTCPRPDKNPWAVGLSLYIAAMEFTPAIVSRPITLAMILYSPPEARAIDNKPKNHKGLWFLVRRHDFFKIER